MGIGRPQYKGAEADFVLSRYRSEDQAKVDEQLKIAMTAIQKVIAEGYDAAQMNINQKKKQKKPKPSKTPPTLDVPEKPEESL